MLFYTLSRCKNITYLLMVNYQFVKKCYHFERKVKIIPFFSFPKSYP